MSSVYAVLPKDKTRIQGGAYPLLKGHGLSILHMCVTRLGATQLRTIGYSPTYMYVYPTALIQ